MHIHREDHSGVALLTLIGQFDSFVLNEPFKADVDAVHDDKLHTIILNMAQVGFMNSPAVGALIRESKRCREAGGDLLLSAPSTGVRMTIESLGLDSRFSIYADDAAALQGLHHDAPVELMEAASSVVLVHLPGSRRPLVCRLRQLGPETMECEATQRPRELVEGREVRLHFRLPLYGPDRFEVRARLGQVLSVPDGVRLALRFTSVPADAQEAIARFLEDIRILRDAAHEGGFDEAPPEVGGDDDDEDEEEQRSGGASG